MIVEMEPKPPGAYWARLPFNQPWVNIANSLWCLERKWQPPPKHIETHRVSSNERHDSSIRFAKNVCLGMCFHYIDYIYMSIYIFFRFKCWGWLWCPYINKKGASFLKAKRLGRRLFDLCFASNPHDAWLADGLRLDHQTLVSSTFLMRKMSELMGIIFVHVRRHAHDFGFGVWRRLV